MSMNSKGALCACGLIWLVFSLPAHSASAVYLNQADGSLHGMGVYLNQLPETARPVMPRQRPTQAKGRQPGGTTAIPARAAANLPKFPDVGAGVDLALSPAAAEEGLPNVGRGVGRD